MKYVIRHEKKNGVEDLKKARVYLDWLIEHQSELKTGVLSVEKMESKRLVESMEDEE